MFTALKIRRAAARLTATFPEIPVTVARTRARRVISRHSYIRTDRVGEFLIHGERMARMFEEISRTAEEER